LRGERPYCHSSMHTHTHTPAPRCTHTLNLAACGTGRWILHSHSLQKSSPRFYIWSKEVNFHTKSTPTLCSQSVTTPAFNFNSDPTSPHRSLLGTCVTVRETVPTPLVICIMAVVLAGNLQ